MLATKRISYFVLISFVLREQKNYILIPISDPNKSDDKKKKELENKNCFLNLNQLFTIYQQVSRGKMGLDTG